MISTTGHFHGSLYPIQEGATYNAYLVVDDEVTLFDTVEEEFAEEMLERIRSVIGDRPVDNIIVQHAEPDHSGGFLHVMRAYPQAKVYASNAGANNMMKQYFKEVEYNRVKTKEYAEHRQASVHIRRDAADPLAGQHAHL